MTSNRNSLNSVSTIPGQYQLRREPRVAAGVEEQSQPGSLDDEFAAGQLRIQLEISTLKFHKQARVPEGTVVVPGRAFRAQIALARGLLGGGIGHRVEDILCPQRQPVALVEGVADFGVDNDAPIEGVEVVAIIVLEAAGLPGAEVAGPQHGVPGTQLVAVGEHQAVFGVHFLQFHLAPGRHQADVDRFGQGCTEEFSDFPNLRKVVEAGPGPVPGQIDG